MSDYYGSLPTRPTLIARASTKACNSSTSPLENLNSRTRELRPVGSHALQHVWEDNLALKVHALLDSKDVQWTSTDVVRFAFVGYGGKESPLASVILWIGVVPRSLNGEDGRAVAFECLELLKENGITDVDVEVRGSVVTPSAGPKLLKPGGCCSNQSDPAAEYEVREPLTTAIGLPICAESTPWVEGTGGFFFTEDGKPERLLLATARHVVFPPDKNANEHFAYTDKDQARHKVRLFGDAAFKTYLQSLRAAIEHAEVLAAHAQARLEHYVGLMQHSETALNRARTHNQGLVDEANATIARLSALYHDVKNHWASSESRVLGHVVLAPPIGVGAGTQGYTEDWAVIEIDPTKVSANNFEGNVIHLGTHISPHDFKRMMDPPSYPPKPSSFEYPFDRLLRVTGTIPDEEMRCPPSRGPSEQPYLTVIKRGQRSGVTVGRANTLCSYTRCGYFGASDGKASGEVSKQWCILPFDNESGSFSDRGDSGAVVVDKDGRIGGLLTSGAGSLNVKDQWDLSYATPIGFLLSRLEGNGFRKPNLTPTLV